jgi:hypothetical protein
VTDTRPTTDGARYAHLLDQPMTTTERAAIEALVQHGSQNVAAAALGWKRTKLQSRLRAVQARVSLDAAADRLVDEARAAAGEPTPEAPVVRGRVSVLGPQPAPPCPDAPAGTRVYILTAAQNNTPVHAAFLANLEALAAHRGATIMVSRFTYNKAAYGKKSTKAGRGATSADTAALWYDPAILKYVCDEPELHGSCRWQLAPDLLWCAEMNILPTAVLPLSGLESYAGTSSGIFPHAKVALESIPVLGDRPPKFNYTTGAVTQRNYIAKKEGLKGEFHHQFGALLVEVDDATGDWWCRQLNATDDGNFYDLTTRVADGKVETKLAFGLLAFQPGDVHAIEIDQQVATVLWGRDGDPGALDYLRPAHQFVHDTFSHRNRSHHELKSFEARYAKWCAGELGDSVEAEVEMTAALLRRAHRPWCKTVVVSSNHDRHLERWLDDTDYKQDLPNAAFFLEAQLARVRATQAWPDRSWSAFQWAAQRAGCPRDILFLARDQSFRIGAPGHEIECGSHGDEGPNGSRGAPGNLSKLSVRMNTGHTHSACLRHGLAVAGVCNRRLPYAHGASSWSVSHTGTYQNGKRVILTARGAQGKLWL